MHCKYHVSTSRSKALYGTTEGTYSAHVFRPVTFTGRYELNKLTSPPMCVFIALLVEHRTGHVFESR